MIDNRYLYGFFVHFFYKAPTENNSKLFLLIYMGDQSIISIKGLISVSSTNFSN